MPLVFGGDVTFPVPVHRQSGGHSCFFVYGFGRLSLKWEVQWDVRVRSSSCGAYCHVVHSPSQQIARTIVATATVVTSCSPLSLRSQCAAGVFASRCRVVVEVFLQMMLTILRGTAFFRRREIHIQLLPVPRRCWVCCDVLWW